MTSTTKKNHGAASLVSRSRVFVISSARRRTSLATHAAIARASRAARSEAFEGSSVVSENARRVVSGDHRPALGHATRGATAAAVAAMAAVAVSVSSVFSSFFFFFAICEKNDAARGDAENALERDAARGAQQTHERFHLVVAFAFFLSRCFIIGRRSLARERGVQRKRDERLGERLEVSPQRL